MNRRDPALEIFRGIAICEVVIHHVTGFARVNVDPATPSNLFYTVANRTLHFAVPAFLFLMGVLLACTMAGGRSWRGFFERRARQTAIPYLIWSVFYAGFALWFAKVSLAQLADWRTWAHWLLWGKAWNHLYFLVLAIQLALLFPVLLPAMRRWRFGVGALLAGAAAAQLGLYLLHARLPPAYRLPYPSTVLLWHLTPVLAGVWVGVNYERWEETWRRLRWLALPLMLAGLAWYVPQGVQELRGGRVDGLQYHLALWSYTLGMSFCLLAFSRWLARRLPALSRALQALGVQSMQIYLVHPMVLFLWYVTPQSGTTLQFHLKVLAMTLLALGVSLGISRLAARFPIGQVIFGRGDVPLTPLPGAAARTPAAG